MTRFLAATLFLLFQLSASAQVEMADKFRAEGKIYIVIAVILVIMGGFFVLLSKLDQKTKRLEQEIKKKNEVE
ncbi:MAG: CcmD family protein [Bacteroidota bacterium]